MRADYFTAAVRTGGEGPAGISMLVIPGDLPGVERTKLDKMGWLASDTATLYFDDVRVPERYLLGEENAGFSMIVNNFNAERMDLAVQSIAFARVCYNEALAWARERETFGKRLAEHQVIRHKLVEMDRAINAHLAWLELLSWRLNQGDDPVAEIAEAKVGRPSPSSSVPGRAARFSAVPATSGARRWSASIERYGFRPSAVVPRRSCGILPPDNSASSVKSTPGRECGHEGGTR